MNPSRVNHPDTIEAGRVREIVRQAVEDNPGITVKEIAMRLGKSKQTIYQHIGILRSQGKLESAAQTLTDGKHGKQLGYSVAECTEKALNVPSRFDYPSQTTVAAADKAGDVPPMDNITALLFGRITVSEEV